MSDRCYISMSLLEDQREIWEPIIGRLLEHQDSDGGVVDAYDYDANYGLYEERLQIAEAGCTFFGEAESGDEYGAAMFGAVGGKHGEIPLHDGSPCVELRYDTGRVRGLKKAKEALALHKAARTIVDAQRARKPRKAKA